MDCVFVGAGAVATRYAAGLPDSPLDLVGVADLDVGRAESLATSNDAAAYGSLDEMLEAEPAPLVVNLTSHGAHAGVTERALAADRHVFTEKPLALETERAAELVQTAASSGLGLAAAPISHRAPTQRHAASFLADGRFGQIRLGYAYAHVGRVTEWHDDPDSFLAVGPLYDGAVYPLSLLVAWFGPVKRIRTADSLDVWPEREPRDPEADSHVEATLEFARGPVVRLAASFYAPHRSREFYSLELHGDDGSLYLGDVGALDTAVERLQVAGSGRDYVPAPIPYPTDPIEYLAGPERLAAAVERGESPTHSGKRAAHVVGIISAIERAAADGGPVPVEGSEPPAVSTTATGWTPDQAVEIRASDGGGPGDLRAAALDLPPIGFGCSRYRDGEYVDRIESIATALDAGYRLFDSAELYGNEHRIGDLLAAPGSPDPSSLFLTSKVWNTNHGHVAAACEGSLAQLGLDAIDCYMLHWPDSWEYQGSLERLAERPPAEQEALAFPTDEAGDPATVDQTLEETWARMEGLHDRGLARSLGVCNVSLDQLRTITAEARIQPAIVQVESHPYDPKPDLVEWCHDRGIRVMAHSPLSAPGLRSEPIIEEIAADHGISPAAAIVAWNVGRGVVPIPSSNDPEHIVDNLAGAAHRLSPAETERIAALADPSFER